MAHFVIIGGGIAGLPAANALADAGANVTALEQYRHLGSRARTPEGTTRCYPIAVLVASVSSVPSALRCARCAQPDPCPLASQHAVATQ